ncbi:MAG: hypothetical protein Sapg2KO_34660 [Saprospiraceae bacterium]
MAKIYKTPGVYIEEKSAFPNSVVSVATAVPAFIGYTEKAMRDKKDVSNEPTRISSFGEFLRYFGGAPNTQFDIKAIKESPGFELNVKAEKFYLFYSMKLFFANGGGDCYIVSIGDYQSEVKAAHFFGPNVGINTLEKYMEPTMVVAPDVMLLAPDHAAVVQNNILNHCGVIMRNRIAIFDIPNGYQARNEGESDVIQQFRTSLQSDDLNFGAAYYPWVETSITNISEINFEKIHSSTIASLIKILNQDTNSKVVTGQMTAEQATPITEQVNKLSLLGSTDQPDPKKLHQSLMMVHPLYHTIIEEITKKINLLPPSGGMAGIYTMVDNNIGVFQSPANVSMGSVVKPAVNISDKDQEDLNTPLNGKAVNAIRSFPGKGVLVWGARTLDGNSMDWRYISVRRTVIMIEQSVKNAAEAYVFEPNTASTWSNLKAMLTNFLTNVCASGALAGATPEDAFSIDIGLGVTMTPVDILEGIMRISIKLAVTRPAEFIIITFEQQMQKP